ncbi:XRE family transcriptional regulator [Chelatococcus sp. SYSU_G07232]|uniref:XRE family transcriptional regulator n=1 Tax=Chelatococcus albus TaxID=3047466 RepID=A0ABT7AIZ8_9HYPH|nr:XRE family transcriptional regulator [Chelatococcus sp. SYSU_G07232]MDJ1159344.1 XRE family transcriptional regulator [Chelatococcus sp. SYSU_G07232]
MDERNAPPIGPVIQQHRKARGLTLEQLAQHSGVSKSMLSQIERGQANPTFAVLWSLTRALRIDFARLVDNGSSHEAAQIERVGLTGIPEIRTPDGLGRLRILSPPQLAGATEWYELHLEPGGVIDSAAHAPGAAEHLTALDGPLAVTSGSATARIEAGETARYPADVPHRIENPAQAPARGLLVVLFR